MHDTKPREDSPSEDAPVFLPGGWVEHRMLVMNFINNSERYQRRTDERLEQIGRYIAGQKAVTAAISALFGGGMALFVHWFKK